MQKKSAARVPGKRAATAGAVRQIRIIGGQWRRTPLTVLDAEGLRPTPDRVRETLFNWLTHLLDGQWGSIECLDLFAGSGALGFEAASRGAAWVTMVDAHTPALKQIEATRDKLAADRISVVRSDALTFMQKLAANDQGQRFDLIFIDPPYHQNWVERLLPLCSLLLRPGGLVYVEQEQALICETSPATLDNWHILRADRAGMVFYHLIASNSPS